MKFLFALVTQCWHKSFWVFDTERYWKAYNGGFFFCLWVKQGYTKGTLCLVRYNPLTPTISSSNRGGGVAPDCMNFALKASFPWLQAPFCLWSVRIRLCLPTTYKNDNTQARGSARDLGGGDDDERAKRFIACAVFKICLVHLFNSGLYSEVEFL